MATTSLQPAPQVQPQPPPAAVRQPDHAPRVSVVIVNYCQWRETARLVRQLRSSAGLRQGEAEVMVVDNHSPPHPLAARLRRTPGVSLRRWRRNLGFGRAVNEGVRLSRGDWLLLLNPDVGLPEGFLDRVLDLADRLGRDDPEAGVLGFQLRNGDGSRQLSCGRFPSLPGTLLGLALPRARRKYRPLHARRRSRVAWATGCCLLVRSDCFRQLGGFDADYFLYYEDVDLCRRARARGWKVWYEPTLRVVHHRPLHRRAVVPRLRLCTRHGLLTYASKHWAPWQFRLLAGLVAVEAWLRQRWAAWRGNDRSAARFGVLREMVADLARGHPAAARRRLADVMQAALPLKRKPSPRRRERPAERRGAPIGEP